MEEKERRGKRRKNLDGRERMVDEEDREKSRREVMEERCKRKKEKKERRMGE